jgi:hypothetical protein
MFLLLFAFQLIFRKHIGSQQAKELVGDWLLLLTTLSCVLSVTAGILLSKESGYDADAINAHKWFGVGFTAFMLLWYALKEKINFNKAYNVIFCIAGFGLNLFAGHLGSNITHGTDFVYAPLIKDKPKELVSIADAFVYKNMVQPILDAKCMNCHNTKKAKGNLIMETEAALIKGGKSGSLWDLNEPDLGIMLRRIHLPEDQKKHMPPTGKTQLTDEEIAILTAWVKKGSDFKLKVTALANNDSLFVLAKKIFSSSAAAEVYDFAAAGDKKIASLNTENRIIHPIAIGSPALDVSFFGPSLFRPEQLNDLLAIKQQIVSLNLEKMPLTADAFKTITQFNNLRKINLSFTPVTSNDLASLNKLSKLKSVALANVALNADDLKRLCSIASLQEVFLWNSGIDDNSLAAIQNVYKKVRLDKGFNGAAISMQLNTPIIETEERVIRDTLAVRLKHYIKGVSLRYTLDGTDPDSVSSPAYNGNLVLNKNVTLKIKAFKAGWLASDIIESSFFKNTHPGDTAFAITQPAPAYKANGAKTLIDGIKGDNNFRSGKWIGFRENRLETLIGYNEAFNISSVTLSTLADIGSFIFPPKMVQVYGGLDKNNLHLLGQVLPQQPDKAVPLYLKGIDINCKPQPVKFIKIIAIPVGSIPAWHAGKGQKAWVFADEIFVN